MKLKPAERNAIKTMAEQAEQEISRLENSLSKFKPGTLPHQRIESLLVDARAKQRNAEISLSRTTQPN